MCGHDERSRQTNVPPFALPAKNPALVHTPCKAGGRKRILAMFPLPAALTDCTEKLAASETSRGIRLVHGLVARAPSAQDEAVHRYRRHPLELRL